MSDVLIHLPATSPMWDFQPDDRGSAWMDDKSGKRICRKSEMCAAEIVNAQFNQVDFVWSAKSGVPVSLGVDGQLSGGDGGAGSAQVPVAQGVHTARIQVGDGQNKKDGDFGLIGATLKTTVTFASPPQNFTLDDTPPAITYTGWTSTTPSTAPVDAIRAGKFYHDTISYTSTAGSAASFSYTGQLLYIFGCTGPSFGVFQISIDGTPCGTYNATAETNMYGTLLYVGQQGEGEHTVEVKNMVDGRLLALDYFVATSSGAGGGDWNVNPAPAPIPVPGPSSTIRPGPGRPSVTPAPTGSTVFPGSDPALTEGDSNNSGIIGGILGALAAVLLLFLFWRHRKWKKAGGEGSFFASLCGPRKKAVQTAGTAKNDFKLWPMVRFRPKYAT